MTSESSLERKVCAYAKNLGVLVYKFSSPAHRGVPDRIFIHDGKILFAEFKAPGKKPTALQMRELARLSQEGMNVVWVDNYADAVIAIKSVLL